MKLTAGHPHLCTYRRSGLETVLLHLSPDGTTWNPPGHAEVRWEVADSGDEFRFFAGDGKCTAMLQWNGHCYKGVLLDSIDASLEIYRERAFVPRLWTGSDDDARRELTVVIVANSFKRGFATLWSSCRHWGITALVLGFGSPFAGLATKTHLLYRALIEMEGTLLNLSENHSRRTGQAHLRPGRSQNDPVPIGFRTVMFLDGFDTIVLAPASEIMRTFREIGRPLVFSAERNCAPAADRAERYPPAPTPYRFLNSGTFIGDASYLLTLLARWDVARWPAGGDDQLLLTDAFLAEPSSITIDHHCRLFQCMYCSGGDVQFDDHGILNCATDSRPLVVHGNGWSDMSGAVEWFSELAAAGTPRNFRKSEREIRE